jgi:hypothetical protein
VLRAESAHQSALESIKANRVFMTKERVMGKKHLEPILEPKLDHLMTAEAAQPRSLPSFCSSQFPGSGLRGTIPSRPKAKLVQWTTNGTYGRVPGGQIDERKMSRK